ncbi:hypothetical protein N0K21_09300 [Yersinia aleksiciae]|nr:hypothetical protein [Yersinia aleksiciae]NIK99187.1 hypothetical protein [Yersinia aleksiciae]WQC72574.1 hypothetical protein N0K21_09300 [Yersinia aleksiciae]
MGQYERKYIFQKLSLSGHVIILLSKYQNIKISKYQNIKIWKFGDNSFNGVAAKSLRANLADGRILDFNE